MINPQMAGQGANVPSVAELWKDEKSKYRHWIIMMGLGLVVILGLLLASFIFNMIDQDTIKTSYKEKWLKEYSSTDVNKAIDEASKVFTRMYIIQPSISLLFLLIGLVTYIGSIFQSYKLKNFAKISSWPTLIVGVSALFAAWGIISGFGKSSAIFSTSGGIFSFIANILFVLFYFSASAPVSRIRRQFLIATRMEQLQKDPNYHAMQAQMQQMMNGMGMPQQPGAAPFTPPPAPGPIINPQSTTGTTTPNQGQTAQATAPVETNTERKRLEKMKLADLKEIAKEFSISGSSSMSKEELIESILRVSGEK